MKVQKLVLIIILFFSIQHCFSQESLTEKRDKYVNILNNGFKKFKGQNKDIYRIARTKGDKLNIFITHRINYNRNDFYQYEDKMMRRLCFVTAHLMLEEQYFIKFITDYLEYNYIIFVVEIEYADKRQESKFYITSNKLKELQIPFRESEFLNKLK